MYILALENFWWLIEFPIGKPLPRHKVDVCTCVCVSMCVHARARVHMPFSDFIPKPRI